MIENRKGILASINSQIEYLEKHEMELSLGSRLSFQELREKYSLIDCLMIGGYATIKNHLRANKFFTLEGNKR